MSYPDVRRANPADQEKVGDLWVQLLREQEALEARFGLADDARKRWDNDFPMWLEDETHRVYVAARKNEIVAFATAHRWGPPPIYADSSEVSFNELYVHPDERRQGLGTQLVAAVQSWTDRIGAQRIRLDVLSANEEARAFWAAQDAVPLSLTFTIERRESAMEDDERSEKIGF